MNCNLKVALRLHTKFIWSITFPLDVVHRKHWFSRPTIIARTLRNVKNLQLRWAFCFSYLCYALEGSLHFATRDFVFRFEVCLLCCRPYSLYTRWAITINCKILNAIVYKSANQFIKLRLSNKIWRCYLCVRGIFVQTVTIIKMRNFYLVWLIATLWTQIRS